MLKLRLLMAIYRQCEAHQVQPVPPQHPGVPLSRTDPELIFLDRSANLHLVRMVLEKHRIHLTARNISLIISRETGNAVSVQAVLRSLDLLPVHVIETRRRKYRIIPSQEAAGDGMPKNMERTESSG